MEQATEGWARLEQYFQWMPVLAQIIVIFAVAILVALLIHRLIMPLLTRLTADRDMFWRSTVARTGNAIRLTLIILSLSAASTIAPLTERQAGIIRHAVLIGVILLAAAAARTVLHIWMTVYLRRFKLDVADNLLARKHVTQSRILERIAVTLIIIITIASVLMTFEGVAKYGVSLLASAGAAGIIVGFALQPLLKNLFAGLQLAITQPIRVDDALLIEGEWGNVEEITSTYVVVKIWDWRRLIVPLSYFIEQPFQNWTRETASLIGNVILYLDYSVPVDAIREELDRIVKNSPYWDGNIQHVQVTDFKQFTMEIRILVTAGSAAAAFDLRCEVREKLIAYLQEHYPHALPRLRMAEAGGDGEAPVTP